MVTIATWKLVWVLISVFITGVMIWTNEKYDKLIDSID